MRVALINGSPKVGGSASDSLLADLKYYISERAETVELGLHNTFVSEEALEKMRNSEVWVFAYPLYVDGIPAHLLSCLIQLEKADWQNENIHIYGIVNCGFYEGIQTEYALELLRNWCIKTGFTWGGGVGVGGGGSLAQMPAAKRGQGPKAPIEGALGVLADKMLQYEIQENKYVSVAFPRFLYKMAAQMGWRQMIRSNGGKMKDLGKGWKINNNHQERVEKL